MKHDWSQSRREAAFYLAHGSPQRKSRTIPVIYLIFFVVVLGVFYHG